MTLFLWLFGIVVLSGLIAADMPLHAIIFAGGFISLMQLRSAVYRAEQAKGAK
jgi:hypothetical protein